GGAASVPLLPKKLPPMPCPPSSSTVAPRALRAVTALGSSTLPFLSLGGGPLGGPFLAGWADTPASQQSHPSSPAPIQKRRRMGPSPRAESPPRPRYPP